MLIESQGAYLYEIMRIKTAIKERDTSFFQNYQNELQSRLSVPRKEVVRIANFTLCSDKVSYHLLSIYSLLDLIESYWDGRRITTTEFNKKPPFLPVLSLENKIEFNHFEKMKEAINKIKHTTKKDLHIFIMPFESDEEYVLESTFPKHILVVFPKENELEQDITEELLFKGVGELYFNTTLKSFVPTWADSEDEFLNEFVKWCKGNPSKFKI